MIFFKFLWPSQNDWTSSPESSKLFFANDAGFSVKSFSMHALHWWRDFNMRHALHFYIWKLRINNVILSQYRYQDSRRLVLFAALNWFMGPSTNNVCNFLGIFTLLSPILAVFFSAKGFFMSLISSKKRTKEFDFTTMIPQVDLFLFVFWKNWRHQKDMI